MADRRRRGALGGRRLEGAGQLLLARGLERAVDAHEVRLVLTTGDNIYLGHQDSAGTGNEDDDWYSSFYQPYRYALEPGPVLPDRRQPRCRRQRELRRPRPARRQPLPRPPLRPGTETGSASLGPGLFYRFQLGAKVEFICIDTSIASGMDVEHYFDDPAHSRWVRESLAAGGARWRIPFSHHPPFCAGPEHTNTTGMVERLVPLFERAGVRLVLSGHEHNFQHAVVDGIHYVVSGAAGKLRTEAPRQFEQAGTRAWAAAGHFLVAHADERRLTIHPVAGGRDDGSLDPIEAADPSGRACDPAIEVRA